MTNNNDINATEDLTTAEVTRIPNCDFEHVFDTPAVYDGATAVGPWAFMCEHHFKHHGLGLGTGIGQKLVLVT